MLKLFGWLLICTLTSASLRAEETAVQGAGEKARQHARHGHGQKEAGEPDTTPQSAASSKLRLLYLEPTAESITPIDQEILAGLLMDALNGQEGVLLITAEDIRRRAPMEADRIDTCREELCLYEFAESVRASHILFSEARTNDSGRIELDIALFHQEDAEILTRQTLEKNTAADFSGFMRPAVASVLRVALEDTRPKLLENPFFLGSFSVLSLGAMAGLASLGYVLELETALGRPDVHRSEKERALEQGPTAIWVGAASASVAALGLVATSLAVFSHYAALEE